MAKKRKGKKKGRVVSVDFSQAGTRIKEEGDYYLKPVAIELEEGDKAQYLAWEYDVSKSKKMKNAGTLYNNTSLSLKSLGFLADILEAHGIDIPDEAADLDLDDIIENAEVAGCCVELETFQGKKRAKITDIFSADDVDLEAGGDDGDDKSDKGDSGDEPPDEDEVMEMDEDELEECVDDHDLDLDPELEDIKGKGKKKLAKQRAAVWEAIEAAGGDGYTKDDIMEMSSKELEEVVKDEELEVELEGKVKQKRKQLIEALEEEDLLVEEKD